MFSAAQISLALQNLMVVLCASSIYVYILFQSEVEGAGDLAVTMSHAGIIVMAVTSDLASVARVIAVERDWIVKICDEDSNMLASGYFQSFFFS